MGTIVLKMHNIYEVKKNSTYFNNRNIMPKSDIENGLLLLPKEIRNNNPKLSIETGDGLIKITVEVDHAGVTGQQGRAVN